ncbi:MAG: hypothetical protein AMXMBFR4_04110 [Candidatus Hydrogenedentota bacterium]
MSTYDATGSGSNSIWTIGHSNLSIARFIELLRANEIETVVDVRSKPYSRYCPHFRKTNLQAALREHGIEYIFMGKNLGGRPDDPALAGLEQIERWERISKLPGFAAAIDVLVAVAKSRRTVIMCAEEDPNDCHRRHLVVRALDGRGVEVRHIRKDGAVDDEARICDSEAAFFRRLRSNFTEG